MEEQIYKCRRDGFPFEDLSLANPQGLQGGAYISKLKLLGKDIILQTPRCTTKNGIIKTDKKIYCDLMFDVDDDEARDFFKAIEERIKTLIFDKKDVWFHTEMDMDTIDYHWQNILRSYKGSKLLLRCNIKRPSRSKVSMQPSIQVYDEDESLLSIDNITKGKTLMGLITLSGLKFTTQSFSLDFNLDQAMLLKNREVKKGCLIKIDTSFKNTSLVPPVDNSPSTASLSETSPKEGDVEPFKDSSEEQANTEDSVPVVAAEEGEVTTPQSEEIVDEIESDKIVPDISDNLPTISDNLNLEKNELGSADKNDLHDTNVDQEDTGVNDLAENKDESLEKTNKLNEVVLTVSDESDILKLKQPNEVYMEIYKEVRRRAKIARQKAIEAYLEVKRIKSLYMLEEIEDSEDDDDILESFEEEGELNQ